MNTPTRVSAFAVGLALVFAAALGVGRLAGPGVAGPVLDSGAAHSSEGAAPGKQAMAEPAGLQVSERGYTLRLTVPTAPYGRWPLSFAILGRDGRPATAFQENHEKELHLILVRRDLSGYQHLHPTRGGAGTWSVPVDLPSGVYRVFADFHPAGEAEGLTLGADLIVSGTTRPGLLPQPERSVFVDDYEVTLDGTLVPGTASRLTLAVRRGGSTVEDLQPYLGASGHLVALRAGDLAYLHVHPVGKGLTFDVEVPSTGTYRLYLDFKHRAAVRTAEFTAVAGAGPAAVVPTESAGGHGDDGHGG